MPANATLQDRQSFNYASLDADTCQFVQQQTGEIRTLMKRTAQSIIEIGQKLIAVKSKLGHGRFGDWLEAEFDWTWKTATRFMNVAEQFNFDILSNLDVACSALYILAAPSTPKAVREEAIARAKAGESITYTKAKLLKQKYTSAKQQPMVKRQPEQKPVVSSPPLLTSGSQLEIVAICPTSQAQTPTTENSRAEATSITVSSKEQPGVWWQLGGRHLLYCGNPNSNEFIARTPEQVQLLLAFPSLSMWQSSITADARITLADHLPILQNPQLLDEALETLVLNYSRIGDVVVTCFLPFPDILSVLNRLDRRGVLAEPDIKRCNAVVTDWKKAGLKTERLS